MRREKSDFYGNLYHLNAEEEPEHKDWPNEEKYPYMKEIRPRGVIKSSVNNEGKQTIEDTGPLTRERMKTIDMEFLKVTTDFIKNNKSKDAPFFIWFNTTRMHFRTHISEKTKRLAGEWRSSYHDAMIEHDNMIGELLKEVPDDTIIIYTTDNGPHLNTWPDSGTTPFRSEKNTNWEGAFRVPLLIKYKERIKENQIKHGIVSHLDFLPTLMDFAGISDIKEKLLKEYNVDKYNYNVHLDGYNLSDYWLGKTIESPRREFFYFSDFHKF